MTAARTVRGAGALSPPDGARRVPPGRAPVGVPLLALWIALGVGLVEPLYHAYQRFVRGQITYADPQTVWTAPLSYLLLFLPFALVIHLAARRRGAEWAMRAALTSFLAPAIFGPLSRQGWIHPLALAVVALGGAVQLARLATRHGRLTSALVRWTVVPLLAVSVGLGALVNILPRWRERASLAALPPAAGNAPDVLLIILDTVRAASTSLHGYARPTTPRLERFAGRGVVFEHAVSPAPWTLPAHASVFTGRWPHTLGAGWERPLSGRGPTLAEVLAARGYRTAGFVANHLYTTRETGLARGFARWEDFRLTPYTMLNGGALGRWIFKREPVKRVLGLHDLPGRKLAPHVTSDVLAWLDGASDDRPFFAFLNFFDAHNPYLPPAPYDTMFGADPDSVNHELKQDSLLAPAQVRNDRAAYDAAIAYLDAHLGALLDSLARRGALDNAIVIVTSDHGEEFAEHGVIGHGVSLYMPSLHVPLLVAAPGRIPAGLRVSDHVSTRDIAATVLDLVGAAPDERLPGRSLARCWDGARPELGACADTILAELHPPDNTPVWTPVSRGAMASLLADGRHLIRDGAGDVELYDLRRDAVERRDLANAPGYRDLAGRMDSSLRAIVARP